MSLRSWVIVSQRGDVDLGDRWIHLGPGGKWPRGNEQNLLAAGVHTFEAIKIIVKYIVKSIVKSPFGTISPAFSKAH